MIEDSFDGAQLSVAVSNRDLTAVKSIVAQNKDLINQVVDSNRRTALHIACATGDVSIVEYLLCEGADIEAQDTYNETPLFSAVKKNQHSCVKFLLQNGCKHQQNNRGEVPLIWAVRNGRLKIAKTLLDAPSVDINFQVTSGTLAGRTALHLAAASGKLDLVKLLVGSGAALDCLDNEHKNALFSAVKYKRVDVVRFFLSETDLDPRQRDLHGRTVLHAASAGGSLDIVKALLEKDPALLELKDLNGQTCVFSAAKYQRVPVLKFLSEEKQANINTRDKRGRTPLHSACIGGNVHIIERLLQMGALHSIEDDNKQTPIYSAIKFFNVEAMKYLIKRSVDIDHKDYLSNTPLHYACQSGFVEGVKILLECNDVDIEACNSGGYAAYELSTKQEIQDLFKGVSKHNFKRKKIGYPEPAQSNKIDSNPSPPKKPRLTPTQNTHLNVPPTPNLHMAKTSMSVGSMISNSDDYNSSTILDCSEDTASYDLSLSLTSNRDSFDANDPCLNTTKKFSSNNNSDSSSSFSSNNNNKISDLNFTNFDNDNATKLESKSNGDVYISDANDSKSSGENSNKSIPEKEKDISDNIDDMLGSSSGIIKMWEIKVDELTKGEKLGQGAFGCVYKGMWRGSVVALKQLHKQDEAAAISFLKEVQIMCKLRHANVVQYYGVCMHPTLRCLVMEFVPESLRSMVKQGPMDASLVFTIAKGIALGMNYLHHCNIIHRDLKPGNILLTDHWTPKVCDFGVSRQCDSTATMTGLGTPLYMAPEILHTRHYGPKVDVYAFGFVLWQMFTGKKVAEGFGGTGMDTRDMAPIQIAFKVCIEKIRPVIPSHCPAHLSTLISDCWHDSPDSRPSFKDILERIEALT